MKQLFEADRGDAILDPLIQRTLSGEAIPFDEWLETEYELEAEPDVTPTEEEMQEAAEAREDFLRRLENFKLPLSDRFRLCEHLYGKAIKEPSDELLCLYCELVCDSGYLLDVDRSEHTPEQDALCMLYQKKYSASLYACLAGMKQQSERFRETLRRAGKARLPQGSCCDVDDELAQKIADVYVEIMKPKGDCAGLTDNVASLLYAARADETLRSIEPLFLYRVLTRHAQRLQKGDAPQFDMEALWHYQHYQLVEDNGKNYRAFVRYLSLFETLYLMLKDEHGVDPKLCLYGFDHLSNLGRFYRMCEQEDPALDFDPEIEDIFFKFPFSCFEHGHGDNVMLGGGGLSVRDMDKYLTEKNRRRGCALDRVSAYMNRNLVELTARFIDASPEQVRELCREILSGADLPLAQKPANDREEALLLAAINNELMAKQDEWAEDYLIRAGRALSGDDPLLLDE